MNVKKETNMIIIFEQFQEYRDVNLAQFFIDFEKYQKELVGSVMSHVRHMLLGKTIRIFNSEKTDIEKDIEILKNSEKYNL